MYKKNFDEWNNIKKKIDKTNRKLYPKPREVWNLKLWVNVWSESDGKRWFMRPVLIIQKLWSLYLCFPLTSKWKIWSKFYYRLTSVWFLDANGAKINSSVMLSHLRVFDKKRFFKRKWIIDKIEYSNIKKIIQRVIAEWL